MKDRVLLAELPWPEAEKRIAAGAPIFLPLGSTEQHGHHMAMNVDVVLPTAIAETVAKQVGGLVAPTIAYGNRSQPRTGGGPAFSGTINITAHTFSLLVKDVICDLYRQKVRRIVVLNGHYENIGPSIEGIELALDAIGRERATDLTILRIDHWEMVRTETLAKVFPDGYPGIELEHASVIETSMMLALRPELVDLGKALHDGPAQFRPYDRYPKPAEEVPPSGVLSLTEGSSAEKGRWLLADCETRIAEIVKREFF
ncbi:MULTISPECIES: creatininase [unclassified Mesorhizobium]|uniref:creatininase n=1 Tax=unclassified Mesorhizobium TaxID=325217 RepID=UPI000FCBFB19|nr:MULTISPECIES: creatininase [unclassified Mesorhizobium]RUU66513.1 creatininase [Mesorhizobium sp. M7A.T.Ca.TU.009.01.1.1]RUV47820.1 creatininase [Mesorhizobium sp. M7A.F.Ca.MR.228.00.0.0]RUT84459.1 creatininase [Mesorhizobium sp. M7A.T.Ca.US.000.02.1.1]RUT87361.1 creatininase [Mesorhizobium sp. M7A.T.Ca.US.000.02.2.1]RUT95103.1 creatininase [Mesorhizobium sp. M7A.T.Ca.TU.009.02.1.1]